MPAFSFKIMCTFVVFQTFPLYYVCHCPVSTTWKILGLDKNVHKMAVTRSPKQIFVSWWKQKQPDIMEERLGPSMCLPELLTHRIHKRNMVVVILCSHR
jgi:hypothetical protein